MQRPTRGCLVGMAGLAGMLASCGAILNFDDLEDLPCPCDPQHVCLTESNRCIPRGSVALFKSCDPNTEQQGDELCPANSVCVAVNEQGPRCLPQCTPVSYATPESAASVADQCPQATTCWATGRGGVCSEGICNPTLQDCGLNQRCVTFNGGAGVCFTQCDPYQTNPVACGSDQACHPIGISRTLACTPTGQRALYDACDEQQPENLCNKFDPNGRSMVCDRAEGSDAIRRCYAVCDNEGDCIAQVERCVFARPNSDPQGISLGICEAL